jgi:hypothetical protein
LYKPDISFYLGFVLYRSDYRKAMAIHIIEIVMFAVIIPIDCIILAPGDKMLVALAIAAADSVVSLLLVVYQYYILFKTAPILSYCLLARDTHHSTAEPVTNLSSIETCTSQEMLHSGSAAPVAGVAEEYLNIYGSIARGEIEQVNEYRLPQLSWCGKIYNFFALGAMLVVIVLLSTSQNMNPAEITVLIVFLVLEAYLKLKIIIIMALIALSPLICIFLVCYVCCCKPSEGVAMKMDLIAKPAETEDIVKSGADCAICLMSFRVGEPIYTLKCSDKHIFHEGCLDNWSRVKATCPTCRADLPMIANSHQLN